MINKLSPLLIGDLHIPVPIVQGGMGVKVSTAALASAVAECGGAGTIASVGLARMAEVKPQDFVRVSNEGLQQELRQARSRTSGVIGVNILAALSNFEELARTAAQEKADYIISGAGLPLRLPEFAEGSPVKLIPIVSSGRVAQLIISSWKKRYNRLPDALVVEGPLAGGHLGFSMDDIQARKEHHLEQLVTEVVETATTFEQRWGASIPVIAAGGIYDGADIARFLRLGAKGVQMGTRFVVTHECSVPEAFKQKYIAAREEDIVLIKSPVGLPGRAIRTRFVDEVTQGTRHKFHCKFQCLKTCEVKTAPYCIAQALLNAVDENTIEDSVVFAGQNVYRVDRIMSVKELMETLVREANEALARSE